MRSFATRYGVALLATGLALATAMLLQPELKEGFFFLLLGAVFFASWYGGLGPGLVATLASIAGLKYHFVRPFFTFEISQPADVIRLGLFAVVAAGTSALNQRLRTAERVAENLAARERAAHQESQRSLAELEKELLDRRKAARRRDMGFSVTQILAEAESLETAARPLIEAISEGLGWSIGVLWRVDPPFGTLRCVEVWTSPTRPATAFEADSRQRTFVSGVGFPGRVCKSGEAGWIADIATEQGFLRVDAARKDGLHAGCAFPVVRRRRVVAVLEFYCHEVHEAEEGLLPGLMDLGNQIGQFTERRQTEQRLRLLAEASSVLGTSLDYAATLAGVASLVVPLLADSCVIDIVEEDGSIRRLVPGTAHAAAAGVDETLGGRRLDPKNSRPLAQVLSSGKAEVLSEISDDLLLAMAADEAQLQTLRTGGPLSGVCVPLATRGRVLGALSLVAVASQHRYGPDDVALAEEIARRCAVAVDNARLFREAQRASVDKTRFLAAVSHDLRSPVNAMMLLSTLIRRDADRCAPAPPELAERARELEAAARRFTDLLTNLLDFASLEAGQKKMKDEVFSLRELVTQTVETLASLARAKGLVLDVRRADRDPLIRADRTELGRVLLNLVGNALKFTERGGVTVQVLRSQDGSVSLSVHDTGPGIPREQLPDVFNEFFQVRKPERDRDGGSGLGLAISRRIMRALGGSLRVESEVGRGSTFLATLPADRVAGEADAADRPEISGATQKFGPASLLVIDDEAVAAEALAALLRQEGYRVSVASGAHDGLSRAGEGGFDLVLLDMMMPGMDGLEVAERLFALPGLSPCRIVALTGDVTRDRVQAVRAAGVDAFVSKPFRIELLLETIQEVLSRDPGKPAPPFRT